MAALTDDRSLDQVNAGHFSMVQGGVDGGSTLYIGSSAAPLSATGMLTSGGGVAATGPVMGIASHQADNSAGADGALSCNLAQGIFQRVNSSSSPCVAATLGTVVYAEDDQTVRIASGATYPVLGIFLGFEDDGTTPLVFVSAALNYLLDQATLESDLASVANALGASKIGIEDAAGNFDATDAEAALAEVMSLLANTTAATGGNLVGYDDSGGKTTAATLADALDELYVNATTTKKTIYVPLTSFVDADGDPLAKFADGASTVPGFNLADSEAFGVRWNNHATPDLILGSVFFPEELQDAADINMYVHASKTGATLGDAVTFDVTAFFHTVGALHDADADAGGTTDAMTGDDAAKTVQEVTLALGLADVPAGPVAMSFTLQPTDGTLGTDDVIVEGVFFEYTPKIMTS